MRISKEVWYEVLYTSHDKFYLEFEKPAVQVRSFKSQKAAREFYDKLDLKKFDKHLVMYEKSLLDYATSELTYEKRKELLK